MLGLLGFLTVTVFLVLIMTNRLSVIVALIIVPVTFAVIGGFSAEIGTMMMDGILQVAPTGIMIAFAVLYFGVMIDAGLFDPITARILRLVKGDPVKVVIGTAILTMLVSLDGDGASTFMITITAMLPLYKRLGMSLYVLTGTVALGAGVMNIAPWGGPTARAMTALNVEASELFNPVIPAMIAGIVWVLIVSYYFGKKERKRLGHIVLNEQDFKAMAELAVSLEETQKNVKRPQLFWFNVILTVILVIALVKGLLPLATLFMIAFAIALVVNYPNPREQMERLTSHAGNVVLVSSIIFAAGIFTGILTGTNMIGEMATSAVSIIPDALAPFLPVLVAITSVPLSLVFTPDAYYFGVLPVLSEMAVNFGLNPIEIGRAAILGQMTTGFPISPLIASPFILVSLSGVDFGKHQLYTFKWAFGTTIVMTIVAILTGAISL